MQIFQDKQAPITNPFLMVGIILFLLIIAFLVFIPLIVFVIILLTGFRIVNANQVSIAFWFGHFLGTIKQNGFFYTLPLSSSITVPLKLMNLTTDHLKVNDLNGNPIEIGASIIWRVIDPVKAVLNVLNYNAFVSNQSEIALRTIASKYVYDSEKEISLRSHIDQIALELKTTLQKQLEIAGVSVEEARLTHLAYSPEVAAIMLKRQQATAVFQARQYLVESALSIIDNVILYFEKNHKLKVSDDKKVELINTLLVTMISDKEPSPVITVNRA